MNRLSLAATLTKAPASPPPWSPRPPAPPVALAPANNGVRQWHEPDAAVRHGEFARPAMKTGSRRGTASWPLPPSTAAVPPARRLAGEQLELWGFGHHRDTAELLVSELVTNAVRHGRGEIHLIVCAEEDTLRIEVHDEAAESVPQVRPAGEIDEGGRGLHLVGMLSSRWGAARTATGKIVWFELRAHRPYQDDDPDM
ncbi:ATP-binding protein [Actinoallomurus spadix]|uniref:ATP-binding protein n=1 Tax=Actinoallomurus spadix TaxID=79912 RepID=UPI0020920480|nr:ATP-binding protein [Actinoallomurus spadix]MCO5991723.1 ATP-binding protein [Actinoallomurus spadix]